MDAAEVLPRTLVFVDLETTGGNTARHRITEVGLVRMENGEFTEEWSSLVNPECPIPRYIEDFTGITDAMVESAPRFADIAAQLRDKLRGAVFVAHNARFDYSFLRSEFRRLDVNFSAKVLCTVKLSRRLFPEHIRHNLDAVMERHGLACSARHRALGDARVLYDLWLKLRREVPEATLRSAANALLAGPKLPAHLPADLADDLPEGPGAYRFFGESDVLLYVGKSHSLRTGVLGHFAGERIDSPARRLAEEVRRVDWLETAGELGAALREGEWIRTQKPLHNRRIKSVTGAFTLRVAPAPDMATSRVAAATAMLRTDAATETRALQTPAAAAARSRRAACAGATATSDVCAAAIPMSAPVQGEGQVSCVPVAALETRERSGCFGLFQSEKEARKALADIAGARQLCLKMLGLEESAGSCFAYQVGKCRGACVGKEPPMMHMMRLQLALSALKLKTWPFPGRIALRERAPAGSFAEDSANIDMHVLEEWAYLGTARSEEELAALGTREAGAAFDPDVYRILVRYFSGNPKLDWHDLGDPTPYA